MALNKEIFAEWKTGDPTVFGAEEPTVRNYICSWGGGSFASPVTEDELYNEWKLNGWRGSRRSKRSEPKR